MASYWTHDTFVSIAKDGDVLEVAVRLHVTGDKGRPARVRYDENDHPEEPRSIELHRFEIWRECPTGGGVYVAPVLPGDRAIVWAVDEWFDQNSDRCWESFPEPEYA